MWTRHGVFPQRHRWEVAVGVSSGRPLCNQIPICRGNQLPRLELLALDDAISKLYDKLGHRAEGNAILWTPKSDVLLCSIA